MVDHQDTDWQPDVWPSRLLGFLLVTPCYLLVLVVGYELMRDLPGGSEWSAHRGASCQLAKHYGQPIVTSRRKDRRHLPGLLRGGGCSAGIVAGLVGIPLAAPVTIYVLADLTHAVLRGLGGGARGFEATLHSVAYTYGTFSLVLVVPLLGFYASWVGLLFVIFALMGTHNEGGGKATAVVIIPCLL